MRPSDISLRSVRPASLVVLGAVLLFASGCRHRAQVAQLPPPPPIPTEQTAPVNPPPVYNPVPPPPARIPVTPVPSGGISSEDLDYISTHHPIATQTGYATWYSAPYKGRKAANGEVFEDDALTAAHRTLPMGTLIVVTNLKTGQSSAMRITDRGPFVPGRIVDLTIAAAKATGIYRAGLARVRVDVYEAPKPIMTGGRWCVQIGAFHSQRAALRLKNRLEHNYPDSNVIEFPGQRSYWVRIRPEGDNRALAEYIARHTHPSEGAAFLTRLD